MRDEKVVGNARRMGMMIPLMVFVLIFVVCCGVLAGVFLRAAAINARAGDYAAGVQLCRNTAELCRGGAVPESVVYYDRAYNPVDKENASFYVTVTQQQTQTAAGVMHTYTVSAYSMDAASLYSLQAAAYAPDWEVSP